MKFIVILSTDIILNISEYFTKVIYYKLINSYVYIIEPEDIEGEIILKSIDIKEDNIDIDKPISNEEIIQKFQELEKEQFEVIKPYYDNMPSYLHDAKKNEIIEKYEKQFRNAKLSQIKQIKNPREKELMLKAFYWTNWVKSSKNIIVETESEGEYDDKDTSDINTLRKKDIDIILNEINKS